MESKRFLRPLCVILAVLYALNGVYIVAKRALVALIERFSEMSATAFIQGSSVAELVLFTLCTGICLLCAAFFTRGRLRAAFFVLTGAQAAVALGNLLSPRLQADAMLLSLCVMAASACCSIVGYALLAHAGHANELRAIGWLCAALVGTSPVSYTHLDVYKRQAHTCVRPPTALHARASRARSSAHSIAPSRTRFTTR